MFSKLILFTGLAISLCECAFAQVPAGKLWVLNEGPFGASGAIGYVQYPGNTYTQVTAMDGGGNDLLIHNGVLYAVGGGAPANGSIVRIDTATKQVLDTLKNLGARKLALWNNQLVVTSYQSAKRVRVLDPANNYAELWSLGDDKLPAEAEAIVIAGNRAWVSLPGFLGDNNQVVVIDLLAEDTLATVTTPINPNAMALIDEHLYVQSIDYTGLGLIVSKLDTATHTILRSDTTYIDTYGIFLPVDDKIWFGEVNTSTFRSERIRSYDIASGTVDNPVVFEKAQAPAAINTLNLYAAHRYEDITFFSDSDFTNPDSLFLWDGSESSQLRTVGISARVMRFEPAPTGTVDRHPLAAQSWNLRVWPNPTTDLITIHSPVPATLTLRDATGKVVLHSTETRLSLAQLPAGVYLLEAQAPGKQPQHLRIVRQ
ncbi:MAG: T9SS type A sorting domain-containing protein [Bacteroidetes bacterium]|nr:T9SS type A sorting domain-containing protein [Bacteroidota bacterium]